MIWTFSLLSFFLYIFYIIRQFRGYLNEILIKLNNIENQFIDIKRNIELSLASEMKIIESHTKFIDICNNISEILILQNNLKNK
ncbi:Hsp70 protein [Indivirus ILV1]|uniref:Hsp70 protein n=1 Tax=Indivirus ILV1 TaxID=1977633 RepID=A0A1V0SE99_9VIRU|nr:Hsp70 protein [Indivirus ILV1]